MADGSIFLIQVLNGVQYGLLLFLLASGLTLIFGIMGVINLAHGSFYMMGAYIAFSLTELVGSFWLAIVIGIPLSVAIGLGLELLLFRRLYRRDHLSQILLTYGLVLLFNELQRAIWGNDVHGVSTPKALTFTIPLGETQTWPAWRAFTSLSCIALALVMRQVILKTRFGMRVRAGASNSEMVEALGIDVRRVFSTVFSAGTALAGLAGMLAAPLTTVYPGMGESVLILSFVVVVIGGIGSIKGAFRAARLVGIADTFGKVLLPGLASTIVYAVMAAVLLWRPRGLLGPAFEGR